MYKKYIIITLGLVVSSVSIATERKAKIDSFVERSMALYVGHHAGVCRTFTEQVEHFVDSNGNFNMPAQLLNYWQAKAKIGVETEDLKTYMKSCFEFIDEHEKIFLFLELEKIELKKLD